MRLAPSIEAEKLYIVGDGITWVPRRNRNYKTADGVFTWEGDLPKHTVSETGRVRALNQAIPGLSGTPPYRWCHDWRAGNHSNSFDQSG